VQPDPEVLKAFVPYDIRNGQIFLNSVGATEEEAIQPVIDGCFEIDPEFVAVAECEIRLGTRNSDPTLFPVVVPFSRESGEAVLECVGSSIDEAEVNLSYQSLDADNHFFLRACVVMTEPVAGLLPSLPL